MSAVKMSEAAYKDFLDLLKENDINSDTVRLVLAGQGCGGPSFGLVLDEQKDTDLVTTINEKTFLVDKELNSEFGTFTIKSGDENGYGGFSVEPEKTSGGGCSSCSGGCH